MDRLWYKGLMNNTFGSNYTISSDPPVDRVWFRMNIFVWQKSYLCLLYNWRTEYFSSILDLCILYVLSIYNNVAASQFFIAKNHNIGWYRSSYSGAAILETKTMHSSCQLLRINEASTCQLYIWTAHFFIFVITILLSIS